MRAGANKPLINMYTDLIEKTKAVSVIGLGYVGLPLALELAKKFRVVGYDVNEARVAMMRRGEDPSEELEAADFVDRDIEFTSDPEKLQTAHFHIVAVPTPVDEGCVPNLGPLVSASTQLGKYLKQDDFVVYESTVYPGCTEEDCVPILERESGLRFGTDFKVGYSPERINPGDKEHTVANILKVVSGSDDVALEEIAAVYGAVITAGIYRARSIKVAEAAKVIENTQRDLNIGFVNELAIIFDKMGIDTQDVLEAAGTKWNFLRFTPGLVGGHCIGVDPYYLLHKSKEMGLDPQVIMAGRSVNNSIPGFIAKRLVQALIKLGKSPAECRVLVMGITFKENVSDIRNSKVEDLMREIEAFSVAVEAVDPHAAPEQVERHYGRKLVGEPTGDYDAVIVAVAHRDYLKLDAAYFRSISRDHTLLFDLKAIYPRSEGQADLTVWRL